MKKTIEITGRYIWLPIKTDVPDTAIAFYAGTIKIQEIYIGITEGNPDFYAWFDTKPYAGSDFSIEGNYKEEWYKQIRLLDEIPSNHTKNRPLIHYAPAFGWLNDPNGLIYQNGIYHIYHQHNPYGVKWENMHWAYTQTTDFIHFTKTEDVLFPNEEGPAFSGTAIQDRENSLGFGADTIAYFYTSAGGRSKWSSNYQFTQKIAISTDGGKTLTKSDKFFMPHMEEENRDPKVLYHEESKSYIMVLYISDDTFYFFRSEDLMDWEKMQELTIPGMWECPDFFPIACEEDEKQKWVLWSADGYYCLGDFDGRVFRPDRVSEETHITRLEMYDLIRDDENKVDRQFVRAYAAQTFQGVENRILQLSWITSLKKNKNYAGMLSLPAELYLDNTSGTYRIRMNPARELLNLRKESYEVKLQKLSEESGENRKIYEGNQQPIEIELNITKEDDEQEQDSYLRLSIFQTILEIDWKQQKCCIGRHQIVLDKKNKFDVRIYADIDVFEIFACNGTKYVVVNNQSDSLDGTVQLQYEGITGNLKIHVLNSMQFEGEENGF